MNKMTVQSKSRTAFSDSAPVERHIFSKKGMQIRLATVFILHTMELS
jgi:hypothetical protein